MATERDQDTRARYSSPGPHVVTPELARRGNELLAEAEAAKAQALTLGEQICDLDRLREDLWERHKAKRHEAAKALMGDARLY